MFDLWQTRLFSRDLTNNLLTTVPSGIFDNAPALKNLWVLFRIVMSLSPQLYCPWKHSLALDPVSANIISSLFLNTIPMDQLREFVWTSRHQFGDHSLYSHNLCAWSCIEVVRRIYMLVTVKGNGGGLMSFTFCWADTWVITGWRVTVNSPERTMPLVICQYSQEAVTSQIDCVTRASLHSSYGTSVVSVLKGTTGLQNDCSSHSKSRGRTRDDSVKLWKF